VVDIAKPTTQPVSWSVVNITKPTYTPSPLPTVTATATESPELSLTLADTTTPLNSDTPNISNLPASDPQVVDQGSAGGKYILVSISEQHLSAYENGQLVYSFVASTGMHNGTRAGTFSVLDKIPNAYGSTWNIWMPNWLGIYWSGSLENGIHALPILPGGDRLWSGYLGTPISFGCVVLGVDESLQLYNWADVGTPVEIRW
jgi:lipoprotein-anchoring transpeptidase ErfK/SrfK